MNDFEAYIEQQEAAKDSKQLENERLRALSAERIGGFIKFMLANQLAADPVYDLTMETRGYYVERHGLFSNKPKFVRIDNPPADIMYTRKDAIPSRKLTYEHLGNGWLVVPPEEGFNRHDTPRGGVIVMDDGDVLTPPGGARLSAPAIGKLDEINITPPHNALVLLGNRNVSSRNDQFLPFVRDEEGYGSFVGYGDLLKFATQALARKQQQS